MHMTTTTTDLERPQEVRHVPMRVHHLQRLAKHSERVGHRRAELDVELLAEQLDALPAVADDEGHRKVAEGDVHELHERAREKAGGDKWKNVYSTAPGRCAAMRWCPRCQLIHTLARSAATCPKRVAFQLLTANTRESESQLCTLAQKTSKLTRKQNRTGFLHTATQRELPVVQHTQY